MDSLLTVVIPQYIRYIKLADKQRPLYYQWNGRTISAKNKIPINCLKENFKLKNKDKKQYKNINISINDLKESYFLASETKTHLEVYNTQKEVDIAYNQNKKIYLYQIIDENNYKKIIANSESVGKPKFKVIKGQDIYSGMDEFIRGKMMLTIKNSFIPYLKNIKPIKKEDYPCILICELHDTFDNIYDKEFKGGQRWDVANRLFPYMKAFPDVLTEMKIIIDDERSYITGEQHLFFPIENQNNRKLVFHLVSDKRPSIINNPNYKQQQLKKFNIKTNGNNKN